MSWVFVCVCVCIPKSRMVCTMSYLSGRWNYLYLYFPVFSQGILVICALLLFLNGVRFSHMLCNLYLLTSLPWDNYISFIYFFPLTIIVSSYRPILPLSATQGSTSQNSFFYLGGREILSLEEIEFQSGCSGPNSCG